MRPILKLLSLKLMTELELLRIKICLVKGYTANWSREIFINNSVLKANSWTYKLEALNGEQMIGNFYEKEFLVNIL